jgi:mRNA interferase MazF
MSARREMTTANRGEVWLVDLDLGLVAKVRPCLVLSIGADAADRALVTIVPPTTSLRGSRFEVSTSVSFLKPGGFDTQNLNSLPHAKLIRRLGNLPKDQFEAVEASVLEWLGFR